MQQDNQFTPTWIYSNKNSKRYYWFALGSLILSVILFIGTIINPFDESAVWNKGVVAFFSLIAAVGFVVNILFARSKNPNPYEMSSNKTAIKVINVKPKEVINENEINLNL